jgi:hypothetical protein
VWDESLTLHHSKNRVCADLPERLPELGWLSFPDPRASGSRRAAAWELERRDGLPPS